MKLLSLGLMITMFFLLNSGINFVSAQTDHSVYTTQADCLECHPRALPTHRRIKPVTMKENWPVDSSGRIVCMTCHDCISGTCMLRKKSPDICRVCHDCTRGMSCLIGTVHLGNSPKVTSIAQDCLSAHDGTMGKAVGGPDQHKTDVLYLKNSGFKSVTDKRVVIVDGKVTCISCHNPYRNDLGRLSRSNANSSLCLTCHIK